MILLLEPQMRGVDHAEVNAGFIEVVRKAFRDEDVVFWADASQIEAVLECLGERGNDPKIAWKSLSTPNRHARFLQRGPAEVREVTQTLAWIRAEKPRLAILLSSSGSLLYLLKLAARATPDVRWAVVVHSELSGLLTLERQPELARNPFFIGNALRFPTPANFRIWTLGASIPRELARTTFARRHPRACGTVRSPGMPYLFDEAPPNEARNGAPFQVAVLGGNAGRLPLLSQFIQSIEAHGLEGAAHYTIAGRAPKGGVPAWLTTRGDGGPLSRIERTRLLRESDCLVYLHPPESCVLAASAAIFDAITHARPFLGIRNPYFEEILSDVGDTGELATDLDDLVVRLSNTIGRGRDATHSARVQRMAEGQVKLGPEALSRTMRELVERWDQA